MGRYLQKEKRMLYTPYILENWTHVLFCFASMGFWEESFKPKQTNIFFRGVSKA